MTTPSTVLYAKGVLSFESSGQAPTQALSCLTTAKEVSRASGPVAAGLQDWAQQRQAAQDVDMQQDDTPRSAAGYHDPEATPNKHFTQGGQSQEPQSPSESLGYSLSLRQWRLPSDTTPLSPGNTPTSTATSKTLARYRTMAVGSPVLHTASYGAASGAQRVCPPSPIRPKAPPRVPVGAGSPLGKPPRPGQRALRFESPACRGAGSGGGDTAAARRSPFPLSMATVAAAASRSQLTTAASAATGSAQWGAREGLQLSPATSYGTSPMRMDGPSEGSHGMQQPWHGRLVGQVPSAADAATANNARVLLHMLQQLAASGALPALALPAGVNAAGQWDPASPKRRRVQL